MYLRLFRIYHDRKETAVPGTVKGQEVQRIGCTAKHALPWTVCRVGFIWYLINLLLAAQKRLNLLYALRIGCGNHLRHFDDPMPLQLSVDVIIVQFAQVIGKPFIPCSQQPEKRGFPGSLPTHQTEHDIKFAARPEYSADSSH